MQSRGNTTLSWIVKKNMRWGILSGKINYRMCQMITENTSYKPLAKFWHSTHMSSESVLILLHVDTSNTSDNFK